MIDKASPRRGHRLKGRRQPCASGRGIGDDPNDIVDAFEPKWDDLAEKLENDDSGLKDEMKDFFNKLIPGEEDLGDILFGDFESFADRVKLLDTEKKQAYTDELQRQDIIEIKEE